jgi:hypothetical protein
MDRLRLLLTRYKGRHPGPLPPALELLSQALARPSFTTSDLKNFGEQFVMDILNGLIAPAEANAFNRAWKDLLRDVERRLAAPGPPTAGDV